MVMSPTVMGISRNSRDRMEEETSAPKSSPCSLTARRESSGKITLDTDSTRTPARMV